MSLIKQSGSTIRVFLMNNVIFMMIGIYLGGFENVHWFMYFLPVVFTIMLSLGICLGLNLWQMLLERKTHAAYLPYMISVKKNKAKVPLLNVLCANCFSKSFYEAVYGYSRHT